MKGVTIAINYWDLWHDDDIVVTVNSFGAFVHQGRLKLELISSLLPESEIRWESTV